jgi:tetraacyldisaccharide 4'-kinase
VNKVFIIKRAWVRSQALFYFLWKRSLFPSSLFFSLFHYFLIPFTFFYRLLFYFYRSYFLIANKKALNLPVISVGNISLGGTGKSLLVAFLVRKFKKPCEGILLRGHNRPDQKRSLIVSLGDNRSADVALVGDEAAMHAFSLPVPVVVGASRLASAELLAAKMSLKKEGYFLLDDGYQQFGIKHDCSILVMDGRSLWGNGWTVPAGNLREYDISRADIIVISHALHLSAQEKESIKNELQQKAQKQPPCFFGYHKVEGYFEGESDRLAHKKTSVKKEAVALIAGIGSFDQFVFSVEKLGKKVVWKEEFPDHYQYSLEDLVEIMHALEKFPEMPIVTTLKDWVKIYPLLQKMTEKKRWMIIECSFSFMTPQEEMLFLKEVKKCVEIKVD